MEVKLKAHVDKLKHCYEEDAKFYDENRFGSKMGELYCEAHYRALLRLLQSSLSSKGDDNRRLRVLDIATGTGRTALRLAEDGIEVVGLDITMEMMRIAIGKKKKGGRVDLVQGDAFALPFGEGSFDAVICCRMLQMIPRDYYLNFGKEIERVLKPEGILIAELWNRLYHRMRYIGKVKKNTWGMMDTFVTPSERDGLFGESSIAEEMAGLGFPLVLRTLGRLSGKWGLRTYMKLSQNALLRGWGETFLARYRILK